MTLSEVDTPALLIDLDVMERNSGRVAEYARTHNLRLRPHTKTHKIPALARRQRLLGAAGITVAKVGEAEVMLAAEPDDLLVAYPVLGPRKLARLMAVAGRTKVTVALDSLVAAEQLSGAAAAAGLTIGVLVEFDAGLDRMGVRPGEELVTLAREVTRLPGLTLEGLSFYPGHIKHLDEDGLRRLDALADLLAGVEADFARAGIPIPIVSGGSTPTLFQSHRLPLLNEIRPGTYIFNDRNTVAAGACTPEDCAVSILVTVISNVRGASVMIDGGSKTFSSDRSAVAGDGTCGRITEAPDARFVKMNEEHGFVDVRDSGRAFAIGDRMRVVPNHVCVAMNLHEQVYGIRGGEVEQVWRVEARGKLQ